MQYKTIVLELLKEQPETYRQLRASRTLLSTLGHYAIELKESHEHWKEHLSGTGSDPVRIGSEAMEIAVRELEGRLRSGSLPSEPDAFPLGEAMDYVRRHTPSA